MNPSLVESSYDTIQERVTYLPENYVRLGTQYVETAPDIDPLERFAESRWSLQPSLVLNVVVGTKRFRIRRPISVRVYREGSLFFAENENLVICGTGADPTNAVEDLYMHLVHFSEYYESLDEDQLTGDALRLKDLYHDLLIEE